MSQSWRRACGSRPVVGSSRNSSSGSPTSAQATARRCCCPPESLPTQTSAFSSSDTRAMASSGVEPLAIEAAKQRQRFADRELFGELGLLQRDADALADVVVLLAPAHAEHFDLAGRRVEQAFEDLDRGRLAGAVRAQQAEALARARPRGRGRAPLRPAAWPRSVLTRFAQRIASTGEAYSFLNASHDDQTQRSRRSQRTRIGENPHRDG